MRPKKAESDFDVVIVGSGVAGALAACNLRRAGLSVLILEAGGYAPDGVGRFSMVDNFIGSPTKSPDSPFCGDNILAVQPNPDSAMLGRNYYDYDYADYGKVGKPFNKSLQFLSYYERVVGGSTWHWQGIYVRMLPNDFQMNSLYGVGFNWPITYSEVMDYYVKAEKELGVAGNVKEEKFRDPKRSPDYPMPALAPSYLDSRVAAAVNEKPFGDATFGGMLRVTTVPHAINSQPYDGRPACDGRTSCVPLCPIQARYEAIIHVNRAVRDGAELRPQCAVTRLDFDNEKKSVTRVWFRRWTWDSGRYVVSAEQSTSGKIVILAANGIENPMILLRSSIKNDAVGRYLMDHPIKQSFALAKEPLYPFRGPQTTSQIETFRDGIFRKQFAGFKTSIKNDGWATNSTGAPRGNLMPDPPAAGAPDWNPGTILDLVHNRGYFGKQLRDTLEKYAIRQITLNSACEQLPNDTNRVMVSDKHDELGIARPLIRYQVDGAKENENYVRNCFSKINDLHAFIFKAMGAEMQVVQREGPKDSLVYGGSGHIMGTTIMGKEGSSVVNSNCRSHEFVNLYILGSSVFPTGSTANPTSTIAALSIRAAEKIISEFARGG